MLAEVKGGKSTLYETQTVSQSLGGLVGEGGRECLRFLEYMRWTARKREGESRESSRKYQKREAGGGRVKGSVKEGEGFYAYLFQWIAGGINGFLIGLLGDLE